MADLCSFRRQWGPRVVALAVLLLLSCIGAWLADADSVITVASSHDRNGLSLPKLRWFQDVLPSRDNSESDGSSSSTDQDNEDLCTTNDANDETLEAACLQYSTTVFARSRAVARLRVHKSFGTVFCTAWLLGCEGHVLTNRHCVSSENEANTTTVEFLAQGTSCNQSCASPLACPGEIVATSTEIVAFSPADELDYVLLLPATNESLSLQSMVQRYGFLSLRDTSATLQERVYIPQHPGGFGKRIALKYDDAFGEVVSLQETGCNAKEEHIAYMLNTGGGSSGAPVIANEDGNVIGLHYCGGRSSRTLHDYYRIRSRRIYLRLGCRNSAIPGHRIVQSLQQAGQLPLCATAASSKSK